MKKQAKDPALQVYSRMLHYAKPYTGLVISGILASVFLSVIDATISWMIKPIVNQGFISKDAGFLGGLPFFIVLFFVLRGATGFVSTYCVGRAGRSVVMDLRRKIFDQLLALPAAFYDKHPSGQVLSILIYNVTEVTNATTDILLVLLREGLMVVGSVVVMFLISWQLSLIFLCSVPFIAWLVHYSSKRMRRITQKVQAVVGQVTQMTKENIKAYKTVRLFAGQAHERARFAQKTKENQQLDLKLVTTTALNSAVVQILVALPIAWAVYLSTTQATSISPGSFIAVIVTMVRMLQPMRRLTQVNGQLQSGIANASAVFDLLAQPTEQDLGKKPIPKNSGCIHVNQVSFTYQGRVQKALDGIDFFIMPGQTVALVGQSGSGKSTLINLLLRLYTHYEGEITLDGCCIQSYGLQDYRSQIGYVSQHIALFDDTLFQNIAYGCAHKVSKADILRAAEAAQLGALIEHLPQGLDTMIGENGMHLSGGQRQCIAIARALLKKSSILILDEATASLDAVYEQQIQLALDHIKKNRTILVVAHRLSTIQSADQIMVLDQGRIVERGSHQELLKRAGSYANLYHTQLNKNAQ